MQGSDTGFKVLLTLNINWMRDPCPLVYYLCFYYLDVDMAHDYEMVHLSEREHPHDINIASSSTNTLVEHSRKGRISKRRFIVHVLHSTLLVIFNHSGRRDKRWEHRVSVYVQKVRLWSFPLLYQHV